MVQHRSRGNGVIFVTVPTNIVSTRLCNLPFILSLYIRELEMERDRLEQMQRDHLHMNLLRQQDLASVEGGESKK